MKMNIQFFHAARIFLLVSLILLPWKAFGTSDRFVEDEHARIIFPPKLESMAMEVKQVTPRIKEELQHIFEWELRGKPLIILLHESGRFQQMVKSPLTIAFAQPKRNLVVIDCSRTNRYPSHLRNVVKHELCHLYIHQYVENRQVPRWLDEGIAQWASDGISDIVHEGKRSFLNRAAFTGELLPIHSLSRDFPLGDADFILAYEESKDFVVYMVNLYGKNKMLRILDFIKAGENLNDAVYSSLNVSLGVLEKDWRSSLESRKTWFAHLSFYLYEFLFAFGAMITVYAFIRIIIKKKRYLQAEDEDDPS